MEFIIAPLIGLIYGGGFDASREAGKSWWWSITWPYHVTHRFVTILTAVKIEIVARKD